MKHHILLRMCALACILILLLPMAACYNAADVSVSDFSELFQTADGKIEATLLLTQADMDAHKGETVSLYELLPGESFETRTHKDPIAAKRVNGKITLQFDRHPDGRDRLYSSFLPLFEDGTPVTNARMLSNPALGADSHPYLWKNDSKGLIVEDPSSVGDLHLTHAALSVRLSELWGEGKTVHAFFGSNYHINDTVLSDLDAKMKVLRDAGMQLSLTITADSTLSVKDSTALIDFLAERYSRSEQGIVTAVFLEAPEQSVSDAVTLYAVVRHAFLSHVADCRTYLTAPTGSMKETIGFFAAAGELLARAAVDDWGASITLHPSEADTPNGNSVDKLTPDTLSEFTLSLAKQINAPARRAISKVTVAFSDAERQAAEFAYLYAKAREASYDLILYSAQKDDTVGLFTEDGDTRVLTEFFADIDAGLSQQQLLICRSVSDKLYEAVHKLSPTRRKLSGTGSAGTGSGKSEYLLDFTTGETYGCSAYPTGNVQSMISGAYQTPALYVSFFQGAESPVIYTVLENGQALKDASSVSLHLLAQGTDAESTTLTLTLSGVDSAGNILTVSAKAPTATGSWQNVNFNIANFATQIDHSHPVTLTLTAEPNAKNDDGDVSGLWVKSVRVYSPESDYGLILTLSLIGGGLLLGFLIIYFFYRRARRAASYDPYGEGGY